MHIESSAFREHGEIPQKYTCDDRNVNPPFEIFDVPAEAKSLMLIMDDHDKEDPSGEWTHWVVWNIDPRTKKISKNSIPEGATEGNNSFGKSGYIGPCPLFQHMYRFRLYALDTMLDLKKNSAPKEVVAAIHNHKIEKCILTCFYDRDFGVVV